MRIWLGLGNGYLLEAGLDLLPEELLVLLFEVLNRVGVDCIVHLDFPLPIELIGLGCLTLRRILRCLFCLLLLTLDPNDLIITPPLLMTHERLICLLDPRKAVLITTLVDIGMVDFGQADKVGFDLFGGGGGWDLEHLVEGPGFGCGGEAEKGQ